MRWSLRSRSHRSSTSGRASPAARGHVGQRRRQLAGQVEDELAEQHEAPQLVGDGDQVLPRVFSFRPRAASSRVPRLADPALPAPSALAFCARVGASRANRMSRADSAPSSARSCGQPSPPPIASMTAKPGVGFSAKMRADLGGVVGLRLQAQAQILVAVALGKHAAAGAHRWRTGRAAAPRRSAAACAGT